MPSESKKRDKKSKKEKKVKKSRSKSDLKSISANSENETPKVIVVDSTDAPIAIETKEPDLMEGIVISKPASPKATAPTNTNTEKPLVEEPPQPVAEEKVKSKSRSEKTSDATKTDKAEKKKKKSSKSKSSKSEKKDSTPVTVIESTANESVSSKR